MAVRRNSMTADRARRLDLSIPAVRAWSVRNGLAAGCQQHFFDRRVLDPHAADWEHARACSFDRGTREALVQLQAQVTRDYLTVAEVADGLAPQHWVHGLTKAVRVRIAWVHSLMSAALQVLAEGEVEPGVKLLTEAISSLDDVLDVDALQARPSRALASNERAYLRMQELRRQLTPTQMRFADLVEIARRA